MYLNLNLKGYHRSKAPPNTWKNPIFLPRLGWLKPSKDSLPSGWGAERFKIVEGGDARVGIKGTGVNQRLETTAGWALKPFLCPICIGTFSGTFLNLMYFG